MKNNLKFFIVSIILCVSILFLYKNVLSPSSPKQNINNEFPYHISEWNAEELVYNREIVNILSPDKIIFRNYRNGNNEPLITLFIAYYSTLEKADLSHSPIVCFTAQGWQIESLTIKEIPVNLYSNSKIKVNQMVQKRLDTTMITLFWYQSPNSAFENRGKQKISLFLNRLLGKSDDNAFISINTVVPEDRSIDETTLYLYSFVQDIYPELKKLFM